MRMAEPDDENGPGALLTALARILRPLLRVFVREGITLPVVYRALKVLYVEVAERDFALDAQPMTDSRIAILTGVHRRDVRRLRAEPIAVAKTGRPTLVATVVGRWLSEPETLDAAGAPLPLPRTAEVGPSFESLVASVSQDVRPRTVLDEMARQGLVTVEDGRVALAPDTVAGARDLDQKLYFFAMNAGDHMAAAAENLMQDPPPNLERAVFYNRLSPESVAELEAMAREEGMAMLLRLNAAARARQARDAHSAGATQRFRFGVYFYREDENDDA